MLAEEPNDPNSNIKTKQQSADEVQWLGQGIRLTQHLLEHYSDEFSESKGPLNTASHK